jgi:Arc/MetJ-type ribon-helix-helix transcriptional regulator
MVRPKVAKRKIKTGITLDPEMYEWIQSKIKTKEFQTVTHAVERGLFLLREKLDGKNK